MDYMWILIFHQFYLTQILKLLKKLNQIIIRKIRNYSYKIFIYLTRDGQIIKWIVVVIYENTNKKKITWTEKNSY